MPKHTPRLAAFVLLCLVATHSAADDRSDAIALFNFAQSTYPAHFSPASDAVQEIEGYLVRYFAATDTYLGTRGQEVYVRGDAFGPGVIRVGVISDFISTQSDGVIDISKAILLSRAATCSEYAGQYQAFVKDVRRNMDFAASLSIGVSGGRCTFTSNNIPNHDMGEGGSFATPVAAVAQSFSMPASPALAASSSALTLEWDNAVLLNGVKVDIWAAACFGVGDGKIGCNNPNQLWRYDPMSPLNQFGTDIHNAHTQPNGAYHYHGNPKALFLQDGGVVSPVVGFAADGFPIYGSWFDAGSGIRKATSSYRLKSGNRPTGAGNPGGTYDGTYRDDYEFVQGLGDLDRCNGMTVNGVYGYYVTDAFPWMMNCFSGTPDSSFRKTGGG